jgi:hypothetical protein
LVAEGFDFSGKLADASVGEVEAVLPGLFGGSGARRPGSGRGAPRYFSISVSANGGVPELTRP